MHRCYQLRLPELQIPLFNAGSATMFRGEGFWMFELTADDVGARRGAWDGDGYRLEGVVTRI